jgi:hypothetical protein
MKIDMVFTYCDGTDPEFIKKKEMYLKKGNEKNPTIRYLNVYEIKYSVKSVLKFIPWINMIYIVTNNQIPPIEPNSKIKIIDHTEIIPEKYLPTFNSDVIESFMHNIPNLTEIFMYNNDDFMHANYIKMNDIIKDNKLIIRNKPDYMINMNKCEYLKRIYLTSKLFYNKNSKIKLINNHHTKILRKSTMKYIELNYPKLLHELRINKTRNDNYIQYLFFCINIDNIIYNNIILLHSKDVLEIHFTDKNYDDNSFKKVLEKRPKFLCLNDMNQTFKEPLRKLMSELL